MSLYKICKSIDYNAKAWQDYCIWRQKSFTEFQSLVSTIQNCIFEPNSNGDWECVVSTDQYLTDIVNDLDFAKSYCEREDAQVILSFDFIENTDLECEVIGYDILDGALNYSLLTNFGNDISLVNKHLQTNGLILDRVTAIKVHEWFLSEMPDDPHVHGSKICSVYQPIKSA